MVSRDGAALEEVAFTGNSPKVVVGTPVASVAVGADQSLAAFPVHVVCTPAQVTLIEILL